VGPLLSYTDVVENFGLKDYIHKLFIVVMSVVCSIRIVSSSNFNSLQAISIYLVVIRLRSKVGLREHLAVCLYAYPALSLLGNGSVNTKNC
jgi:hypothetical protein